MEMPLETISFTNERLKIKPFLPRAVLGILNPAQLLIALPMLWEPELGLSSHRIVSIQMHRPEEVVGRNLV